MQLDTIEAQREAESLVVDDAAIKPRRQRDGLQGQQVLVLDAVEAEAGRAEAQRIGSGVGLAIAVDGDGIGAGANLELFERVGRLVEDRRAGVADRRAIALDPRAEGRTLDPFVRRQVDDVDVRIREAGAILDAEFLEGEVAAIGGVADVVDQRPVAGQSRCRQSQGDGDASGQSSRGPCPRVRFHRVTPAH